MKRSLRSEATLVLAAAIATMSCVSSSQKPVNGPKNPTNCTPCQAILSEALRKVSVANQTYKPGYMARSGGANEVS